MRPDKRIKVDHKKKRIKKTEITELNRKDQKLQ